MLTADAINPAPGLRYGLYLLIPVYLVLTVTPVYVLRRLADTPFEQSGDDQEQVAGYRVVRGPDR